MKVIRVTEKNLPEIGREVSSAYLRDLRRRLQIANRLETTLFFIPYYMYPLCGDIPRDFIVSEEYLSKHFGALVFEPCSEWMRLTPKEKVSDGETQDRPVGDPGNRVRVRHARTRRHLQSL